MADRVWSVEADAEGVLDREAVVQHFLNVEAAGQALGGVFQMIPLRRRREGSPLGEYETVGWLFRWDSTAPALRIPGIEPDEQPVVGDEPGAAS